MHPSQTSLKYFLDQKVKAYNTEHYIETDPIQIPHRFGKKEDIEIAAFLTASIAWGQRKSIIKNASFLMDLLENTPYDFVLNASEAEIQQVRPFVHRTFNGLDCEFFIRSLRNIYQNHGGLETVFTAGYQLDNTVYSALKHFRKVFLEPEHERRIVKHVSDVSSNSAAKRLNMLLRWLVRSDNAGVDFGIWHGIPMSALMLPLDVHAGDVGRALGLLNRKQNDWKALEEIMQVLRTFDADDPVKYDYALFGIGVFENKKDIRFMS
jgi:uncharacterized protein (TIGR02757 family)